MSNNSNQKLPTLFWIVVIAAVIWNAVGVMTYFMDVTMSDTAIAALPEAQQALYAAQPAWVTSAYAIAVFAGLGASILLLLRKSIATVIYVVSFFAIIAQMFYVLAMSNTLEVMGAASSVLPALIIIIAAAMIWFSTQARSKGWTR